MYPKMTLKIETPKVQGEVEVAVTDASHAHIHTLRERGICQALTYRNDGYYFSLHVYKVGGTWTTANPTENGREYCSASRGHFRDASLTALITLKVHVLAAFIEEIKKHPAILIEAQKERNALDRSRILEKIREKEAELAELRSELLNYPTDCD